MFTPVLEKPKNKKQKSIDYRKLVDDLYKKIGLDPKNPV
jgi:hypothetical protein